MTKEQEYLENYASLLINKDFNEYSKLLKLDNVDLVNTNEILNKEDYLKLISERLLNGELKLERSSTYKKDDENKGLVIYTVKGNTNYKVVSFITLDNSFITKIEDYWFVIF